MALALVPWLAAAQAPPTAVALSFRGEEAERARLEASLGELLGRLGLKLGASPAARLAQVEADFTIPGEATIKVLDAAGKVVLLRIIPRAEKPAVAIEAAAHIAYAVIDELRQVERRSPLKATGPSPLPDPEVTVEKPRPPSRADDPVAFELGGYANVRIWGGGAPFTAGFGLQLELALALLRLRPALVWSGGFQPPFEVSNDWASIVARVAALRLFAQLTPVRGDHWRLDAALGAGADVFITTARSNILPPGVLGDTRADAAPILAAQVIGRFGISRIVDVWLGAMVDLDLAPRRFVVDVGGSHETLFEPWRVRPAILLGLSVAPVGREPYAARDEVSP